MEGWWAAGQGAGSQGCGLAMSPSPGPDISRSLVWEPHFLSSVLCDQGSCS